ncbi:hypothetical protein [Aureimonas populi]|uniref:Transporter n=1 Tax=Aureimonas populi TaxID=1701758 RepID=A0ABW5CI45_9HYPH|nr:hypothetical protein [Aureimonas populi]
MADILRYFSGAARLMAGKPDGLKRLDLTADGFWGSFAALLVALPPLALSWIEYERVERAVPPPETSAFGLYGAHLFADATAWLFPILVLMLIARPAGFSRKLVPLVVSLNWGSALVAWALSPLWLALLMAGPSQAGSLLAPLAVLGAMVLTVRLVACAMAADLIVASAIVLVTVVASLIAYAAVADVTGIALV